MVDELVPVTEDPASIRRRAREGSRRVIEERAPRGEPGHGWKDAFVEIEECYGYDAWDLHYALGVTCFLHPKTRPREEDRPRAAARKKRRHQMEKDVRRLQRKWMSGPDPAACLVFVVEVPRPWHELLELGGKAADWMIDEFAGHVGIILGEARRARAGPEEPEPDPYRQAFTFGCQLLRTSGILPREKGGREISPQEQIEDLRERFRVMRERNDLPPAPDDENPRAWIRDLWRRILGGFAPDRRRHLEPAEGLPVPLIARGLLLYGPTGVLEAVPRFDTGLLQRLRLLLPAEDLDLPLFIATGSLNALSRERGIGERVLQALEGPPDQGAAADPPK